MIVAMRAVVITEYGGPEVLRVENVPEPVIAPDEILVAVVASALNRADLLQRMGLYPGPSMDHEIPGLEFAGTVAAVGDAVTRRVVGDRVMGITSGGAHAELVTVPADQAIRVPAGMDLATAGALPEVFITAWDALVRQGGLTAGGVALIHAGASGVGTAAIQLCRLLGATAIVTASRAKCGRCLDLGARVAVDYTVDDWVVSARDVTGGRGVDVVLDVIGGDYLDRNVDALAVGGTIVQVGVMGGGSATFGLAKLLPKRATIRGTVLRGRSVDEKIAVSRAFEEAVVPGFDDGSLEVVMDRRYGLDEIADAHAYMATNASVGKIGLDVVR